MLQRLGPRHRDTRSNRSSFSLRGYSGAHRTGRILHESLATLGIEPNPLHDRLLDLSPPIIVTLDFGHMGMEPLQTKQGRAGAVQKSGEV